MSVNRVLERSKKMCVVNLQRPGRLMYATAFEGINIDRWHVPVSREAVPGMMLSGVKDL